MNWENIVLYVIAGLVALVFMREVLGAVGFRIYLGVIALVGVVMGYLILRYCINWSAISGLGDIGFILLIALAVIVGVVVVALLFMSAGNEWLLADQIARWKRRERDSRRHWWH